MAPIPLLGLLLLLAGAPFPTTAQTRHHSCSTDANYTADSAFSTNLNRLLSSLPANGSGAAGFFDGTAGSVPDRAYGLVLCRGDVSAGECRSCLDTAAEDLQQACPYRRSAVIWYDHCLLRYSDLRFFSVPETGFKVLMWNANNLTEVDVFNRQWATLMAELVRYAYNASALMFATGDAYYVDATAPKIYGLVQCTRDLSADDCSACLRGIIGEIPSGPLAGKRGGRILTSTCNFRYELYPFYSSSAMVSVPLSTSPTAAPQTPAPVQPPAAAGLSPPIRAPDSQEGKKTKNSTGKVLAIAVSLGSAVVLIAVICVCLICLKKSKERKFHMRDTQEISIVESLLFDLFTLRVATVNFAEQNKLGQGGFGSVYKGLLPNGRAIAVKRLTAGSGQGVEELKNEVVLLAKLQHRNLVRLLGLCIEGDEKLLVYEYVINSSLDKFLFDPTRRAQQLINWERRYKIIGGVARGLQYLHEDSQVKIIHRDLKASNILLDADMNPKISDFGLARLFGEDQTQASTIRIAGTIGYMAPEYVMRGRFSNKSDVFSFGVLVLEILTGRSNCGFSDSAGSTDLLSYVWTHWTNRTVLEIIDPSLGGQYQRGAVRRCAQIGLLCVQEAAADRPTMTAVVLMLSSYSVSLQVPSRPAFFPEYSQEYLDVFNRNPNSTTGTRYEALIRSAYSQNDASITELDPR